MLNEITGTVVDTAVLVHRELGPGLLESVYEAVLARVLLERHLQVDRQVPIPIRFRELVFEEGFRADLVVEDSVIVELKSVERIAPSHRKQLLTYLRLADKRVGLLLNFGAVVMREGIARVVNGLDETRSSLCASAPLREEKS